MERVGRRKVLSRKGGRSNQEKRTGGPFVLDGRRLMGGHNNQPKVGVNVRGDVGEERWPGGNMWGGVISSNRASIWRGIKNQKKTDAMAFDGYQRVDHKQQLTKNTCTQQEMYRRGGLVTGE